jgi:hypothetical protein
MQVLFSEDGPWAARRNVWFASEATAVVHHEGLDDIDRLANYTTILSLFGFDVARLLWRSGCRLAASFRPAGSLVVRQHRHTQGWEAEAGPPVRDAIGER